MSYRWTLHNGTSTSFFDTEAEAAVKLGVRAGADGYDVTYHKGPWTEASMAIAHLPGQDPVLSAMVVMRRVAWGGVDTPVSFISG